MSLSSAALVTRPAGLHLSRRAVPAVTHQLVRAAGVDELVLSLSFVHELRVLDHIADITNRACATLVANELLSAPPRLRQRVAAVAAVEMQAAGEARDLLGGVVSRGSHRLAVAAGQRALPSFADAVRVVAKTAANPSLVYLLAAVISETLGARRLEIAAADPDIDLDCADHFRRRAAGEREHAEVFADVCRVVWAALDGGDQRAALTFTPRLLDCYVIPSRANILAILDDAGLDPDEAEQIYRETYNAETLSRVIGPQVGRALKVFGRAGMLDSVEGRRAFGGYVRTPLP